MKTREIRKLINKAIQIENQTGNLRQALVQLANTRETYSDEDEFSRVILFVREYVEHSAAMIDQITEITKNKGIYKEIKHILETANQYFLAPIDLIPDELGLLGLIDDAYLTHRLIQCISDDYKIETGNMLVSSDTSKANLFIRALIGEPHASLLDQAVAHTINGPDIQNSLMSLYRLGFDLDMQGPDPLWGNASIDEIVDARVGAMGII